MKEFLRLLKREFKLFVANDTLRSVFFLAPILYAVLLGFVYQSGKVENIPVLVVDRDNTPLSNQLTDMLDDNSSIKVIKYIQEPQSIKDEVIKNEAAAVVMIPAKFEADMLQKKYPELNVYVNTGNVLTANFASKALQLTIGTFSAGASIKGLQKMGMPAVKAATQYEPFKTNYITLFNTTSNYLIFMWPAMLAVVLQQVILLAMAVSFAAEFQRGSFIKEYYGMRRWAFPTMLIKVIPIWFFSILIVGIYYLMHMIFKVPMPEGIFNFILLTAVFVGSASFLGVFISILIPDALKATQILMVLASPSFIISGFTWPLSAMPAAVQFLANIIPLTPFLQAFKILLIQKGSVELTFPYLQHLIILLIVYGVLGWIALKIKLWKMFRYIKPEEEKSEDELIDLK
ncbi:ABC transporter permease [Elizabethkingia anophelis]|uniref:ABC transporter permease n=1 Tax=Elizabethkingia anophelis TaxID=1117645 RepID=UPI000995D201|nr:ABC transporter permease [Elizabethkingia anophelis]AQW95111.1 ABC transporter permease [Elizabethkingia anophelis]MCW2462146.1 ABC-2 type transport system permease protein [Elizabethkingia anophelis]MCW2465830.1 ABC-2 type transport system permease protein [Elizabethkingia anophelis]MCW2469515.1 ABC-2 type transport system permease protein [Elizabethkingia anophelis]MDV3508737.1 ABC transporter permease [Elizabethkingia anophelis]